MNEDKNRNVNVNENGNEDKNDDFAPKLELLMQFCLLQFVLKPFQPLSIFLDGPTILDFQAKFGQYLIYSYSIVVSYS